MQYSNVLNKTDDSIINEAIALGTVKKFNKVIELLSGNTKSDAMFLQALALLNIEEREKSLALFQKIGNSREDNFLAAVFCDYITNTDSEAKKMYGGEEFSTYFISASKSPAFEGMYRTAINTIIDSFRDKKRVNIVDIGIGGARQIGELIGQLSKTKHNIKCINILGAEPYEHMRKKGDAVLNGLKEKASLQIQFQIFDCFAQNIDVDEIKRYFKSEDIDVINACASIHHMPEKEKKLLVKKIYDLQPKLFIISDADSNHESNLSSLSFELIANVSSFYDNLLKYMLLVKPDNETAIHYRGFCYFDALDIIRGKNDQRIEYHTTAANWLSYLKTVGFKIISPKDIWLNGIDPKFTRVEKEHLITAYLNRPLLFQIVAKA